MAECNTCQIATLFSSVLSPGSRTVS